RLSSKSGMDSVSTFILYRLCSACSIFSSPAVNSFMDFSISSPRHVTQIHVLPFSCQSVSAPHSHFPIISASCYYFFEHSHLSLNKFSRWEANSEIPPAAPNLIL